MALDKHKWPPRILRTLAESACPLQAKIIAIRCGCVWDNEYATLRHALRRMLKDGILDQDTAKRYLLKEGHTHGTAPPHPPPL